MKELHLIIVKSIQYDNREMEKIKLYLAVMNSPLNGKEFSKVSLSYKPRHELAVEFKEWFQENVIPRTTRFTEFINCEWCL